MGGSGEMQLTNFEKQIVTILLEHGYIPSEQARTLLGTKDKIVLKKANFPNLRPLLCSYMSAFHHGMYRGGMCWVSLITYKKKGQFQEFIKLCKLPESSMKV